jgi:hypothetical protein
MTSQACTHDTCLHTLKVCNELYYCFRLHKFQNTQLCFSFILPTRYISAVIFSFTFQYSQLSAEVYIVRKVLIQIISVNETNSKSRIGNCLCGTFPIHNGLKRGGALSPLLFNINFQYSIRKVQGNQVELKLNGTHLLLVYADDVNLLGDNIDTIKKSTETLTLVRRLD